MDTIGGKRITGPVHKGEVPPLSYLRAGDYHISYHGLEEIFYKINKMKSIWDSCQQPIIKDFLFMIYNLILTNSTGIPTNILKTEEIAADMYN